MSFSERMAFETLPVDAVGLSVRTDAFRVLRPGGLLEARSLEVRMVDPELETLWGAAPRPVGGELRRAADERPF